MSTERHFLGWKQPCLWRAAHFLLERFAKDSSWDLSRMTVVTPGARAHRRLAEILTLVAEETRGPQSPGRTLFPPRFITVGALPEALYRGTLPVMDRFEELLQRLSILQITPEQQLEPLFPSLPDRQQLPLWMGMVEQWAALVSELALGQKTLQEVSKQLRAWDREAEAQRWDVLEALQNAYEQQLKTLGLTDLHLARRQALEDSALTETGPLVLIAVTDLSPLFKTLLQNSSRKVISLIHAPEEEAACFDSLGALRMDRFERRQLPLQQAVHLVVHDPTEEARAVVDVLEGYDGAYAPGEISIGLGDEALAGMITRNLALVAVSAHAPVGQSLLRSRPALLLETLAGWLEFATVPFVASLMRHLDFAAWYTHRSLAQSSQGASADQVLACLDRYSQERVPLHFELPQELQGAAREVLEGLRACLEGLRIPEASSPKPLDTWDVCILGLLDELYGWRRLNRFDAVEGPLLQSLELIAATLRDRVLAVRRCPYPFRLNLPAAIRLLLRQLASQQLSPASREGGIELLGWLELQLDDGSATLITGMNEGLIPHSPGVDSFLPDGLRRALGLSDQRHRFARDVYMLEAILHSREQVTLISARHSERGDPLTPSRLLFTCDPSDLAARVLAYYQPGGQAELRPPLLQAGQKAGFYVPRPLPLPEPIRSLSVTDFRSYLACPYRFYLRKALRLERVQDDAEELDGAQFGTLAHDTLQRLGESEVREAETPEPIFKFLQEALREVVEQRFGTVIKPAISIQLQQLEYRLWTFSQWQALRVQQGWRIQAVEQDAAIKVPTPHGSLRIHGRIDRVDRHLDGRYEILDYKTSEQGKTPDAVHRTGKKGEKVWVDLQLPLYRRLAPSIQVDPDRLALGYINLSRALKGQQLVALASWSVEELNEADGVVDDVVQAVSAGIFWPPTSPPPAFSEDLSAICFDQCVDASSIAQGGGLESREWKDPGSSATDPALVPETPGVG